MIALVDRAPEPGPGGPGLRPGPRGPGAWAPGPGPRAWARAQPSLIALVDSPLPAAETHCKDPLERPAAKADFKIRHSLDFKIRPPFGNRSEGF